MCYYHTYMRYLGIDYGTKRVGLAVSDDGGTMAFPYAILENNKKLFEQIINIVGKESLKMIVVGESLDYKGNPNIVMKEMGAFVEKLTRELSVPVVYEREFLSTQQARFFQKDKKRVDDSAAAIILQSYLDKKNIKPILDTL